MERDVNGGEERVMDGEEDRDVNDGAERGVHDREERVVNDERSESWMSGRNGA